MWTNIFYEDNFFLCGHLIFFKYVDNFYFNVGNIFFKWTFINQWLSIHYLRLNSPETYYKRIKIAFDIIKQYKLNLNTIIHTLCYFNYIALRNVWWYVTHVAGKINITNVIKCLWIERKFYNSWISIVKMVVTQSSAFLILCAFMLLERVQLGL